GVSLNAQEIRNAMNQGVASDLLVQLVACPVGPNDETSLFHNVAGGANGKRQKDRELALRWLFIHDLDVEEYNGDLRGGLDRKMEELNQDDELTDDKIDEIVCLWRDGLEISQRFFGDHTFRIMGDDPGKV